MKPKPETSPETPEPTAEGTGISALPSLSPEEVLQKKIEHLQAHLDAATAENEKLKERNGVLLQRVKDHEENAFSYALANADAGGVLEEAGQMLKEVTAAVYRHKEKGKLSLTLSVKPFKGSTDALVFVPELKTTLPKGEPPQAIFFADDDGSISRQNPRQRELDLR